MSATFEVVGEHVERDVRGNLSVPAARFCFAPGAVARADLVDATALAREEE